MPDDDTPQATSAALQDGRQASLRAAPCTFLMRFLEDSGGVARGAERSEARRATPGDGPNGVVFPEPS